ncbi:hypothetical protein PI23P_06475 [Polaribacter irgensii 23-P]|uniref:Uncharacterized protein n=1 Tax=Polaribacter irgensii 23-P TaxID=313594 RepID=A4BYK4_9FLAO|nr:hypothetical protein [Polaribacter irgensii]EAR12247.1 hypothetical protein PI23P_06475 [Polaribacter irgensii 23-P]
MEVIILDGISKIWNYLLETRINMPGNSFANWAKITSMQNTFINKALSSDAHIIATTRVKQDSVLNQKNGKMVPEKVGLKAIQRNDLDYEFTIVFDIDTADSAKVTKYRTGVFVNAPEFKISSNTGKKIKAWCGEIHWRNREETQREIGQCIGIEGLRHVYAKYPDRQEALKPLITERKKTLETVSSQVLPKNQIIQQSKINHNGISNS